MQFEGKYKSRKFWLAQQILCLTVGVPILFKYLEISNDVTLLALGATTAVGAFYGVTNVMAKKLGGEGE